MIDNEATMTQEIQENTATEQVAQQEQSAPAVESKKDMNLRLMRERWEAAEREKAELQNRIKQWEQQQKSFNNYPTNTPQQSIDDDISFDFDDDSLVEGKQVKKYLKSIAQEVKQTKKELQEARQLTAATAAESYAANRFTDFKQVVTEENLRNLQVLHPDDFNSVMANPDPKSRFVTAYNMIKNYGISDGDYQSINQKIESNKSKPKAAAAAGASIPDTALTRSGDFDRRVLTPQDKKMILNRLAEYKKRS